MKEELDKLLCEKYPKMMVNRNAPMTETCMCWGFECGDGWFTLLDHLMSNIQHYLDWKNRETEVVKQVTLDQVKEKFGTLRFYYSGGDEYISGLVAMAESISSSTCESCGNLGERTSSGWVKTMCKPCEEKRAEARRLADEEWQQRKLLKEGFEE